MSLPPDLSIPELSPLRHTYERAKMDGWKPKQALYIAWRCHPKDVLEEAGLPTTETELAIKLGSKAQQDQANLFRNWKRRYENLETYIFEATLHSPLAHYRPGVIKAMVDTAIVPGRNGHADRKMYFEMTGDYKKQKAVDVTTGGERLPDSAPIAAAIDRALEKIYSES